MAKEPSITNLGTISPVADSHVRAALVHLQRHRALLDEAINGLERYIEIAGGEHGQETKHEQAHQSGAGADA
jgi:hypothetical protein